MKKSLLITAGSIALLSLSSLGYAGWTKFPNGSHILPQGDCWEMNCEYGCVENSETKQGSCCSNQGNTGDSCDLDICCKSGTCKDGHCGLPCEGDELDHPCEVCDKTTGQWKPNNTSGKIYVKDCGVCSGKDVVKNTNVIAPECKKCDLSINSPTRWQWVDDNQVKGDCGICVDGKAKRNTALEVPPCYKCDERTGSSTQWRWIVDTTQDGKQPTGGNSCQICRGENLVYEDKNKTVACDGWCCPTGEKCGRRMNECKMELDATYSCVEGKEAVRGNTWFSYWRSKRCDVILTFPEGIKSGKYKILSGDAQLNGFVQMGSCAQRSETIMIEPGTILDLTAQTVYPFDEFDYKDFQCLSEQPKEGQYLYSSVSVEGNVLRISLGSGSNHLAQYGAESSGDSKIEVKKIK